MRTWFLYVESGQSGCRLWLTVIIKVVPLIAWWWTALCISAIQCVGWYSSGSFTVNLPVDWVKFLLYTRKWVWQKSHPPYRHTCESERQTFHSPDADCWEFHSPRHIPNMHHTIMQRLRRSLKWTASIHSPFLSNPRIPPLHCQRWFLTQSVGLFRSAVYYWSSYYPLCIWDTFSISPSVMKSSTQQPERKSKEGKLNLGKKVTASEGFP